MRKIDIQDFRRATRDTPRAVNRRIILNILREHGPISRADLARSMEVPRGMITSLVKELLDEGLVFEGATTSAPRGRRPTLLHLRSHDRLTLGVDVRASRTVLQLGDFGGQELARESFDTPEDPHDFIATLTTEVRNLLGSGDRWENLEGVGIVVPGMVDGHTGRVLNAPTLGWREVDVRGDLPDTLGVPLHVERDAVACAMAQIWLREDPGDVRDFVYVVVSEGVGTGLVMNGQPVRGRHFTAGEFGHVPLELAGPVCTCGARGCLEAHTSDPATVARYLGIPFQGRATALAVRESGMTPARVIQRFRDGDAAAREALAETGRFLGVGLAGIVNALDPARIIVGGEVTAAWDFLAERVRDSMRDRVLTEAAAEVAVEVDPEHPETRLQGAAALVVAPAFAAPRIA